MFDKTTYFQIVKHSRCIDGNCETSEFLAIKMDDEDGIAQAIGFPSAMISKVDYFFEYNLDVLLIELSDLKESILACEIAIQEEIEFLKTKKGFVSRKEQNQITRNAWKDIKNEFFKKWCGSIAVVERLYRKSNEKNQLDPNYKLLIVCKDHTDIQMLNKLKQQLSGMIGQVFVCNTKHLNQNFILQHLS